MHPEVRGNFFFIIPASNSAQPSFEFSFCLHSNIPHIHKKYISSVSAIWSHTLYPFHQWEIGEITSLLREWSIFFQFEQTSSTWINNSPKENAAWDLKCAFPKQVFGGGEWVEVDVIHSFIYVKWIYLELTAR